MKRQGKQEVHNLHLFHLLHKQREVEQRYKSAADAAETEMGKDVDEHSFWFSG